MRSLCECDPAPDSSAIAKPGANDPIDGRPASGRLTAKGQVRAQLGYVQRGEEPRASSGSNVGLNGAAHEQNVVLVPWSLGRTTTESRDRPRADALRRHVGWATRCADHDVPDELVEVLTEGASIAWTADPDRGVADDEVRLDVLACAVGDPMGGRRCSSTTSRLSHPMRILWFRAHRLGFRASLDVPCATGARFLSFGDCVIARRCPGARWLCCVRIRSVGARHRSRRGSRDHRLWPAWCTSRRRRSCASLLAGPSRIASWVDGRQRSRS